jgi:hypothetical protein
MTSLLPSSLQNSLQEILQQSNLRGASIRAILLSTTDGVPLGRVVGSQQQLNEEVLSSIESVWAPASKQFPVLGLEKVKQVTAIYDHGSLIHIYQAPMVCMNRHMRKNVQCTRFLLWIYEIFLSNDFFFCLFNIYLICQVLTILCGPHSNLGAIRSTTIPFLNQALVPLSRELGNSLQPDVNNAIPLATYYE